MKFDLLFTDKNKIILFCIATFIGTSNLVTAQNIGINSAGAVPDASAILDVSSSDKGVLIPRVALTGTNDGSTVSSPANSLLVYNTQTVSDVTPGFYYFESSMSAWQRLVSGPTVSGVPAGAIMPFNLSTCPAGWVKADGQNGTPDLRGEFIRGLDGGRGIDFGRSLASAQTESTKSHNHTVNPPATNTNSTGAHAHLVDPPNTATTTNGHHDHTINDQLNNVQSFIAFSRHDISPGTITDGTGFSHGSVANDRLININAAGNHTHTVNISGFNSSSAGTHVHSVDIGQFNSGSAGGAETRPRNVAFLYCIKQ